MSVEFRRDSAGLATIINGAKVQALCDDAAEKIAAHVRSAITLDEGEEVVAERYDFTPRGRTSDRAASAVTIKAPNGRLLQAQRGVLTKAASSIGAEVRAK